MRDEVNKVDDVSVDLPEGEVPEEEVDVFLVDLIESVDHLMGIFILLLLLNRYFLLLLQDLLERPLPALQLEISVLELGGVDIAI